MKRSHIYIFLLVILVILAILLGALRLNLNTWCNADPFLCNLSSDMLVGTIFLFIGIIYVRESLYKKVQNILDLDTSCTAVESDINLALQKISASHVNLVQIATSLPPTSAYLTQTALADIMSAQQNVNDAKIKLISLISSSKTLGRIGDKIT